MVTCCRQVKPPIFFYTQIEATRSSESINQDTRRRIPAAVTSHNLPLDYLCSTKDGDYMLRPSLYHICIPPHKIHIHSHSHSAHSHTSKYRRRKNELMAQVKMFIHFRLTQHVSGIIMPIVRRQTL